MLFLPFGLAVHTSDEELVEQFARGDRAAFSQIVRRYQDRVFGLCLRWLNDPQVAEDTAQEVFIAVFKALGRFRGDSKLSTWIFRITVNHCKNRRLYGQRRAQGRHESLDGPAEADERPRQHASTGPGPDSPTHQAELQRVVQAVLAEISEDHRQIILLRDLEDLDYDEIADILEIPRGTVKSRLHRARAEFAQVLGNRIGKEDVNP